MNVGIHIINVLSIQFSFYSSQCVSFILLSLKTAFSPWLEMWLLTSYNTYFSLAAKRKNGLFCFQFKSPGKELIGWDLFGLSLPPPQNQLLSWVRIIIM